MIVTIPVQAKLGGVDKVGEDLAQARAGKLVLELVDQAGFLRLFFGRLLAETRGAVAEARALRTVLIVVGLLVEVVEAGVAALVIAVVVVAMLVAVATAVVVIACRFRMFVVVTPVRVVFALAKNMGNLVIWSTQQESF